MIIPLTRRAHSPNEGPRLTARPLVFALVLREDLPGRRGEFEDIIGASESELGASSRCRDRNSPTPVLT